MSISMAIFTFINSWFVFMFAALPFGREDGEKADVAYKAAPARFNWKKSAKIATVMAAIFTGVLALIINSGLFHMDTLS